MKSLFALIVGIILGVSAILLDFVKLFEVIYDNIFSVIIFLIVFIFLFFLAVIYHERIIRKIISFPKSQDEEDLYSDLKLITSGKLA